MFQTFLLILNLPVWSITLFLWYPIVKKQKKLEVVFTISYIITSIIKKDQFKDYTSFTNNYHVFVQIK